MNAKWFLWWNFSSSWSKIESSDLKLHWLQVPVSVGNGFGGLMNSFKWFLQSLYDFSWKIYNDVALGFDVPKSQYLWCHNCFELHEYSKRTNVNELRRWLDSTSLFFQRPFEWLPRNAKNELSKQETQETWNTSFKFVQSKIR